MMVAPRKDTKQLYGSLSEAAAPEPPLSRGRTGTVALPVTPTAAINYAFGRGMCGMRVLVTLVVVMITSAVGLRRVFRAAAALDYTSYTEEIDGRSKVSPSVRGGANTTMVPPEFMSTPTLKIRAANEYGEYDKASLKMYGLDMVVEPFRVTTVTAEAVENSPISSSRFVWRLQYADLSGATDDSVPDAWSHTGGSQTTLELDRPGSIYVLSVENVDENGAAIANGRTKVSCKYVRREIRDLTDEDREAFFDALRDWYTVPTDVGKRRYGPNFSNYEVVTAYHDANVDNFCYHIGLQFLTSHPAFTLWVERYLQMIDPRVSIPIWDYMVDSTSLGHRWYNSIIFDRDWFGSAFGSPHDSFIISEGRFSNISTIYDPDNTLGRKLGPYHNAYGYVTSPYNYQDLPRISRTSSFCGLPSHATLATAETFVACFDNFTSLAGWESCMETMVHGDIHGLVGGAFNCNTDMKTFAEDHPEFSSGLLSFALELMTFSFWPTNVLTPKKNLCHTTCTSGQDKFCGCTCLMDPFAISEDEVYAYMEVFFTAASVKFHGDQYIAYDEDARYPYGFMQNEERLSDEANLLLMRHLVNIGCEPGSLGAMSTLASPLDPVFHVLHSMFEKALHIVLLSPKYRDSFSTDWVDGPCPGSGYNDQLPFTEAGLGLGAGTTFMTNKRITELMHPENPAMPYIYEDFTKWGTNSIETWNPYS